MQKKIPKHGLLKNTVCVLVGPWEVGQKALVSGHWSLANCSTTRPLAKLPIPPQMSRKFFPHPIAKLLAPNELMLKKVTQSMAHQKRKEQILASAVIGME